MAAPFPRRLSTTESTENRLRTEARFTGVRFWKPTRSSEKKRKWRQHFEKQRGWKLYFENVVCERKKNELFVKTTAGTWIAKKNKTLKEHNVGPQRLLPSTGHKIGKELRVPVRPSYGRSVDWSCWCGRTTRPPADRPWLRRWDPGLGFQQRTFTAISSATWDLGFLR